MKSWKLYLSLVVIFVSGAVLGGALMRHHIRNRFEKMATASPAEKKELMLKMLSRRLDLQDPERDKLAPIVGQLVDRMSELREKNRPQIGAILRESASQIRQVLTPSQQIKFDEMHERFLQRVERHHGLPPGPF